MSVSRSRTTYFSAKYHRIAARRGPIRTLVAVQHSILLAIWYILTTSEVYCDRARTTATTPSGKPQHTPRNLRHPTLARRAPHQHHGQSPLLLAVDVLAGLFLICQSIVTGHSGSSSVWGG
ncbi:hypothetical protein [Burkholderia sp. LFS038]|uniref:hypothetical protein n=1 Tax=Burkholderia sp. LFS038 TaxID=3229884 RepID=UPI003A7FD846